MLSAIVLLALASPNLGLQGGLQIPLPLPHRKGAPKQESYTIADLIGALDQVRPMSYISPDIWRYEDNPIYKALYEEGTPAVEPLIKAYASDERPIDNTVEGGKQDRFKSVRAKDIAYRILLDLLDCSDVYDLSHRPTPDELLAFYRASRDLSLAERHLNVLKDENASVGNWAQAARRLTDAAGSIRRIESFTPGPARAGMIGEPLRKYGNPSVTQLMAERLLKTADGSVKPDEPDVEMLVRSLAKWDLSGGLEAFKTLSRFQMERPPDGSDASHLTLLLVEARMKAGDASAVPAYLAWMKPLTTQVATNYLANNFLFQPFGFHADNAEIRKAVGEISKTSNSIWSPKNLSKETGWFISSPLIVFPEVYAAVTAALDDRESAADPAHPGARVCDLVAAQVVYLHGAPTFDLNAPARERDGVIEKMKAFLNDNRAKPGDMVDWPSSWRDVL